MMRLALVSLMCSLPQVRSFSASLPPAEIKGRLMGLRVSNVFTWPWAKREKKTSILRGHAAAESPPVAREDNRVIEMHGRTRVDPYHWMKDENWQVIFSTDCTDKYDPYQAERRQLKDDNEITGSAA